MSDHVHTVDTLEAGFVVTSTATPERTTFEDYERAMAWARLLRFEHRGTVADRTGRDQPRKEARRA